VKKEIIQGRRGDPITDDSRIPGGRTTPMRGTTPEWEEGERARKGVPQSRTQRIKEAKTGKNPSGKGKGGGPPALA